VAAEYFGTPTTIQNTYWDDEAIQEENAINIYGKRFNQ
jgi:hypothetical protein